MKLKDEKPKLDLKQLLNWPTEDVDTTVPLQLLDGGDERAETLRIVMKIEPAGKWTLRLELEIDEVVYSSDGGWSVFDDELKTLALAVPDHVLLKCCWGCAFSDYSPSGSDVFGMLACFRDNKSGYLRVQSKEELLDVWDTLTELVEETYVCPEFAPRVPGSGYRG